jgi:hypothetical protein
VTELDFKVYGMKLQPGDAQEDADPFELCQNKEIIGVGWRLDNDRSYDSFEEVYDYHKTVYQDRIEQDKKGTRLNQDGRLTAALRYILNEIEVGDYVWVNEGNQFALCKVNGDWELTAHLSGEEQDTFKKNDIHHYRSVDWVNIPYSLVPGYVRRKFSGRFGTLNELDSGINEDSKEVIKALHSQGDLKSDSALDRHQIGNKIRRANSERLFDILGGDETEDIVLSYLQSEGWRIIKSSTSNSQAKIECEMRTEQDGESMPGYVQVKTGDAEVNPDSYEEYTEDGKMIFFVQSGVNVEGREGMSAIDSKTIHEYMSSNYNYLPNETLLKLDFAFK